MDSFRNCFVDNMDLDELDWPTAAPVLEYDDSNAVVWTETADGYTCDGAAIVEVGSEGIDEASCKTACEEYSLADYTTDAASVYGYHAVLSEEHFYLGKFDASITWVTTAILEEYT